MKLAPLLLALVPAAALAQGALTRAPAVLSAVEPVWPADALAAGRTGEVLLEVDISETGQVMDARVVKSAGKDFDDAALAAIRRSTFTPAEIDARPAAVTIQYRFAFTLKPAPPPAGPAPSAPVNLRGLVVERGTKKPLPGADVQALSGKLTATTGSDGRFALAGVPEGDVDVVVIAAGHDRFSTAERIDPGKATEVTYYLMPRFDSPYESVVTAQRERKEVSQVDISAGEIRRIPGIAGDAVKVVQSLPGVARAPFGSGQLVVRGGNPQDTRVYVDGEAVPQIFHFGGIRSDYASELIKDVEFEAGNFGVRYGRAIAGRVEIVTREPAAERLHLVADASLYEAEAFAEGPFGKDVSGAVAVRRSYIDAVLPIFLEQLKNPPQLTISPRYYDAQAKLAWHLSSKDTLRIDAYGSNDRFALVSPPRASVDPIDALSSVTGFARLQLGWDHVVDKDTRLHASVTPGYDLFQFSAPPLLFDLDSWRVDSRLEAYHDFSPQLALGTGLDLAFSSVVLQASLPQPPPPGQLPPPVFTAGLTRTKLTIPYNEPGTWVEAVVKPVPGLKIVPGVRLDYNSYIDSAWLDPRLAVRYAFSDFTTVKAGVGLYHQAPVPQYVSPEFGNPLLNEEGATQYMVGLEQVLVSPLSVDLQLYYKSLFDEVVPVSGPERYGTTSGKSYGAELLLRWDPQGRFSGWLSYSLSRTVRDLVPQSLNSDFASGDAYDQPQNLIALGTFELPEIWTGLAIGFRFQYTTGNPTRQVLGSVYDVDADAYRQIPASVRALRLPDFGELDVRIDKKWTWNESSLNVYLDVYNVTNHGNVEGTSHNFDYTQAAYANGIPFFPSIGVRWEY